MAPREINHGVKCSEGTVLQLTFSAKKWIKPDGVI